MVLQARSVPVTGTTAGYRQTSADRYRHISVDCCWLLQQRFSDRMLRIRHPVSGHSWSNVVVADYPSTYVRVRRCSATTDLCGQCNEFEDRSPPVPLRGSCTLALSVSRPPPRAPCRHPHYSLATYQTRTTQRSNRSSRCGNPHSSTHYPPAKAILVTPPGIAPVENSAGPGRTFPTLE
jgi:hypothetical protein